MKACGLTMVVANGKEDQERGCCLRWVGVSRSVASWAVTIKDDHGQGLQRERSGEARRSKQSAVGQGREGTKLRRQRCETTWQS